MRGVLLCAGFGTRLHPITRDRPKPLLEVGGVPIVEDLVAQLAATGRIDELIAVSNARFFADFEAWRERAARRYPSLRLRLLDDGARDDGERLGAIGDLAFAVSRCGLAEDLLVAGADNLLRFPLADFFEAFDAAPRDLILVHRELDRDRLRRTGVVDLDGAGRVRRFVEKPIDPASDLASPPLYLLRRDSLALLGEFRRAQPDADAPGAFVAWLAARRPVHACELPGQRLDVGDPESYRAAADWLAARGGAARPPHV